MKANPFSELSKVQKIQPRARARKVRNETSAPSRRGKVGLTLYLDVDVHRMMKELALTEERPLSEFLIEGVNLMLREYGRKPIA